MTGVVQAANSELGGGLQLHEDRAMHQTGATTSNEAATPHNRKHEAPRLSSY